MVELSLPTRQKRVQHKELQIIAAASTQFASAGFHKTTMSKIARAAHVADGTLYTYFQSKEDLAQAVIANFYDRVTRSLQEGVKAVDGHRQKLQFFAKYHIETILRDHRILEMLPLIDVSLDSYSQSEVLELNRNYSAVLTDILKGAMAQGHIDPSRTLWVMRDMFFGALEYGTRTLHIKKRQQGTDAFVDEMITSLFPLLPVTPGSRPLHQRRSKTASGSASRSVRGPKTLPPQISSQKSTEALIERLERATQKLEKLSGSENS